MKTLIQEIHDRSVWQVLGLYLAVSWLALQVVDLVIDNFGLPDWVAPFALVLLVIGLPIVLATAFVQRGLGPSDGAPSVPPGGAARIADPVPAPPASPDPPDAAAATVRRPDAAGAAARGRARWFTWKNALLAGVLAFTLLGLSAAGYLVMRTLGIGPAGTLVAKGVIEERSPLIVADFEGPDTELARAATAAIRIDLGQSQVVRLVEPTEVAQVLRRMDRPSDAVLDLELASEVAEREGIPVVLAGEVTRVGDGLLVSARVIEVASGAVLVADRRSAADESEILEAIDGLSERLRERLGESIRALKREEPLARVTTASLEALRRYSSAIRTFDFEGDEERAISLLEEAVAIDTAFAMAWRKLGTILNNNFVERDRAVEALGQAFRHRDRLTGVERYQVEGIYYYSMGPDAPRAIRAYENLLEVDPVNSYALNNLGVIYGYLREHARSQEYYDRAIAVDSSRSVAYTNSAQQRYARGDVDGAREILDVFQERFPDHPDNWIFPGAIHSALGEYEEAAARLRQLLELQGASPAIAGQSRSWLAGYAAIQGKVAEAREIMRSALSDLERAGSAERYLTEAADLAWMEGATLGREVGLATLRVARELQRLEEIPPLSRPYAYLAMVHAELGDLAEASRLLDEFDRLVEPRLRGQVSIVQYHHARALLASAEGRHDEAVAAARRADVGYCTACGAHAVARAFDAAGRPDSAIAAYERYLDAPWLFRAEALDRFVLARILQRLGALYETEGDLEGASRAYTRFVELWESADPELQPRVEAARSRLREIERASG